MQPVPLSDAALSNTGANAGSRVGHSPRSLHPSASSGMSQADIAQPAAADPSNHNSANIDAKATLRRSLLKARQAIPPHLWQHKSHRICQHLAQWPQFRQARTILAYCSFRNEPDLSPLLVQHRSWGLPRCEDKFLIWHRWYAACDWPLQTGAYGIMEPDPSSPRVDPDRVDLILVPAVACDVKGYRLGYGGGFYDRMLSHPRWANKRTIGIVFECARLPQVPRDDWDQPLHGLCTESGLFLARQ